MIKIILIIIASVFFLQSTDAQVLEGRVVDAASGNPLPEVAVTISESGQTAMTDENGNFRLSDFQLPLSLQFSRLGYYEKNLQIDSSEKITVQLQQQVGELSEVIVQSANIPERISKIPAAVSVLSSEDLQQTDNFNFVQNLNRNPGIYVNQGALNTNKINIRGIGSRAQYSTNRVKAYLNGIPLTTAEGALTIDDLDSELIDQVEIYKGPVSSVFGAGLGGAINIFTKRAASERTAGEVHYDFGSFNTRKSGVTVNHASEKLDVNILYNHLHSDGYRENGNFDRSSLNGIFGFQTDSGNYWSALVSVTDLKAYIPSSLSETDYINDPEAAAFTWYQSAGFESYDRQIIGLSYEHSFTDKLKNQTSVFYNRRDGYEPRPFNILVEDRESLGFRTKFNWESQLFGKSTDLSFGAEGMKEWYETATFENLYEETEARRSVEGARLSGNSQDRRYINIFAQSNVEFTEDLLLEAGINFNITAYDLTDEFDDEVDQSGDYQFDPVFSPRIGLTYEAWEGKNFYGTISHGFSTPTVAETLTPEGLINTDLKTETGLNYEIGFKGNWLNRRLYTEINLYSIQVRNLLVARRVDQDQYVGINAGKADHNGMEFVSILNLIQNTNFGLQFSLNGNLTDYVFDKFVDLGENYSGKEIPGVPKFMLNPSVDLRYHDLQLKMDYFAFGETQLNDSNSRQASSYELLNIKARYKVDLGNNFGMTFNFGINNVLDEKYPSSVLTNAVGFGGSEPRYFYPGNPRNYFGGVQLQYNL